MKFNQSWKWLLMAALMLLPSLAFAQIFGGEIPDEDVSVRTFLNPLFGELVGRGGGNDPLVGLIKTFNLGVLTLGGILVFYTLVAGTLSTAHDGEMLGKRWSSLWIPIRTTLGAAAIMPSIGGGYAVIQALVMWLALQGVSMANAMWGGFLDHDPVADAFYVPPGANRQIRETFNDMFLSNVCTAAFKKSQGTIGTLAGAVGMKAVAAEVNPMSVGGLRGYYYGPASYMCGKVMMYTGADSASGDSTTGFSGEGPASAGALVDATGMNAALRSVHSSNMDAAQGRLKTAAQQLVEGQLTQDQFDSLMSGLVSSYSDQLRTTALAQYNASRTQINARMIDGMRKDGWAVAGMYYMAIIRSQDEITRAISQTPAASSGELSGSGSFAIDMATSGGLTGAAANKFKNWLVSSGDTGAWMGRAHDLVKNSNAGTLGTMEEIADDATGKSWIMKIVGWFMNDDLGLLGNSNFAQQGQNPIIMVKNLGENMTAVAWSALGIGGLVLGVSGAGAGVLGDWATVFTPVLFSLFALLVVPGATLSAYIPMIPYILWVGVVLGWVILIVEAIIAAPIWAVAHMAPDGDGVVGRGGQGYMLVLSLVLRPPLMILGLVCSISLMKPLGYFVNSTFLGAFAVGVNPGPMALTQLIAGCIIYTVVMISVIHRVFTLIHVIPDKILRWIGGGGNELGEQAQQMEAFSTGKVMAAVGATQQIGQLTQGAAQGMRDLSRKKADQANAEAIRQEESRSRMAQVEANKNDEAHRAGMEAVRSSAAARQSPSSPEMRQQAAMSNAMARDARMAEAETGLDHFMSDPGNGYGHGLGEFRKMSMDDRQDMAKSMETSNPPMADAMRFANDMDSSRQLQAQNPEGNHLRRLLGTAAAAVQQQGQDAAAWNRAAAKGLEYEAERQEFSKPLPSSPPPPEAE